MSTDTKTTRRPPVNNERLVKIVANYPVLTQRVRDLETEHKTLTKTIQDQMQIILDLHGKVKTLMAYVKGHDSLHAELSTARKLQDKTVDAMKRKANSMSDKHDKAMTKAMTAVANQKTPVVNVEAILPEHQQTKVDVCVDKSPWKFTIERDGKGLIKGVNASPKGNS